MPPNAVAPAAAGRELERRHGRVVQEVDDEHVGTERRHRERLPSRAHRRGVHDQVRAHARPRDRTPPHGHRSRTPSSAAIDVLHARRLPGGDRDRRHAPLARGRARTRARPRRPRRSARHARKGRTRRPSGGTVRSRAHRCWLLSGALRRRRWCSRHGAAVHRRRARRPTPRRPLCAAWSRSLPRTPSTRSRRAPRPGAADAPGAGRRPSRAPSRRTPRCGWPATGCATRASR